MVFSWGDEIENKAIENLCRNVPDQTCLEMTCKSFHTATLWSVFYPSTFIRWTRTELFQTAIDETKIGILPLQLRQGGRKGKSEFWISKLTTICYTSINQEKKKKTFCRSVESHQGRSGIKPDENQTQELEQQCCLGPKRQPEILW